MKLAVDCRMIGSGGIGTYFLSIVPYLQEKFECIFFGNPEIIEKNIKIDSNSKILSCLISPFSIKELFLFPSKLIKTINSCDAYYTPYCNIPNGIKIPVFSTIHDVVFLDISNLTSKSGCLIRKFFYQRAINKSKCIFTVSQFSAERIKHHLKIKKTPVIVTYNSVPEWFKNQNFENIQKSDLLFVGNIKPHKGLHILVQAFFNARKKGFEGKLFIVGNAENFRTTDSSILEKITSSKDIVFTGKISDEELRNLYHKSALLIQPSLYEGFGMPPLEALFCGTNVILSDIPVFTEIYKNFPVTFFKSEDSDDLTQKILEKYNAEEPKLIPEIYSFEKTSSIIINEIKNKITYVNNGENKI